MPERRYQALARLDVTRAWSSGLRRVVLCLPTGAGKTWTAVRTVQRQIEAGARVLWLAHLDLLLGQAAETLAEVGLTSHVWGSGHVDLHAQVQIAGMARVARRLGRARHGLIDGRWRPDLIVVDECHRAPCATYADILRAYDDVPTLGLTATPFRLDGRGLGEVGFQHIVAPVNPEWLIEQGYLTPVRAYAPQHTETGIGDVIRVLTAIAREETRPRIALFARTIAISRAICAALVAAGITAEHVDGDTDSDTRRGILGRTGRIATGETQVVSSVGVLDEGVDCPALDVVALQSGTGSLVRVLQRIGRGLRPAPGKTVCRVVDFGSNIAVAGGGLPRHPWPTSDLRPHYSLTGTIDVRPRGDADEAPLPLRTCPECYAIARVVEWRERTCPACGHVLPTEQVEIQDTGAELLEVDRGMLERLHAADEEWARLVEVCRSRGYRPGWAVVQWRTRHGWSPTRQMMSALGGWASVRSARGAHG